MTTRTFPVSEAVRRTPYNFPDAPPKEDVNDYLFLSVPGYPPALIRHLGHTDTTAVMAGIYISQELPRTQRGLFYPDLVIAFDIDSGSHHRPQGLRHCRAGETAGFRAGGRL